MGEWWENPLIKEIDDFVEKHFSRQDIDDYHNEFNAIHIADWKPQFLRWVDNRKELWGTLEEMVEALPDDESEEYHTLDSKVNKDDN